MDLRTAIDRAQAQGEAEQKSRIREIMEKNPEAKPKTPAR
jgi:hypothetical protein